jgi:hypothetical protein
MNSTQLNQIIAAQNNLRHAWEYLRFSVRNLDGVREILDGAYDQLSAEYAEETR